ncbi:uroporphyrinogen-III synthase [Planctomicrobium piriforme]|uniref:Uroporphyrinogen-III synthase n=2 Tax=Planctomicrobium piriforme TaxID=1576369 RepID=A0A1I3RKJ6_9PLAN|nr:uroporphyrinogen-III synthase [Planctomicrobium piriforme]
MSRLIEKSGGVPTIAPSMREIRLSDNAPAFEFAERLLTGQIQIMVFMTGVGAEALFAALATQGRDQNAIAALANVIVVARGPKPVAALSRLKVRVDVKAPEPNTWQDVAGELERLHVALDGKQVAVQEYGEPSREFYAWLQQQGAEVIPVPVYKWALPENLGPLEEAIRTTIAGGFDILLWTSAQQVNHVVEVAARMRLDEQWLAAAKQCVIGSIGPTAAERLLQFGLSADLEPSHPKMAHLIRETIAAAPAILNKKRLD